MSASNGTGAGLGLDFLSATRRSGTDTRICEKSTPATSRHGHPDARADESMVIMHSESSSLRLGDIPLHGVVAIHQPALSRHGTLLSTNATPERNAAELRSILGSSRARLKPGAATLPPQGRSSGAEATPLEQAKSRARVEVDIDLDSKTCVQGGYLQGHVTVRVRECTNKEMPVLISGGKIRVIGFESISNNVDRFPFYQCSSPLSTVTATSEGLYESEHDEEGFARAIEGEHRLPFSMYLPISPDYGVPKGSVQFLSGVTVRYVAMVSIKVKDPTSNSRSIAHFYRDCEIWPRLNPSVILAPAARPLQATTRKGLFMGGSGKVDLTPSIHRFHWIAGQECFVKVIILNGSKKTINSLTLALIRSTVVFKPDRRLDALSDADYMDPDACQTSTTEKAVAESVLEVGQRATRGHASAKGWWSGVAPGEHREFSHSILLPPDALSVTRSRLLEIDYFIRVTVSAGALWTADIQASIPIRIVNFLSLDPPPSYPLPESRSLSQSMQRQLVLAHTVRGPPYKPPQFDHGLGVAGTFGSNDTTSRALETLAEADEEMLLSPGHSFLRAGSEDESLAPENAYEGIDEFKDLSPPDSGHGETYINPNEELEDLTMYEDDADEIFPHILHEDPEYANAPRFADLYHASFQDGLCQLGGPRAEEHEAQQTATFPTEYQAPLREAGPSELLLQKNPSGREYQPLLRPNARPPIHWSRPGRPQGPSSFAQRVQIKLEAATASGNPRHSSGDVSFAYRETSAAVMHGQVSSVPSTEQTVLPREVNGMPRCMQDPASHHSADFSGHLQYRNPDPARTVVYPPNRASSEDGADCHTASHFSPTSRSETSLPYRKSTSSAFSNIEASRVEGGSRLLPTPPFIENTTHISAFTALATARLDETLHFVPIQPVNDDRPGLCRASQVLQHPTFEDSTQTDDERVHEAVSSVDTRRDVGARPSILALKERTDSSSTTGSSSSVKERIRELEERQRLLELNGP
ncbi:putative arrestin (or S-antigen), C-terminal domain [Lyophyllum shimeji]|uniref:Arrestin (Or S-antigen), C-terminal domain n=1 Tax=Lyophyllum shimeji TaxID=47721 RepID=A0A9P3PHG2_LYOSH|nr:putative arrestin (or S-antigen), C-terminal domain [Lyophyllum shimeji]